MITDLFIQVACTWLSSIIGLLPAEPFMGAASLWDGFAATWNYCLPQLDTMEHFAPLNLTFMGIFGLLSLRYARLPFRAAVWLYRMVPFVGH